MPTLEEVYAASNVTRTHKDFVFKKVDELTAKKKGTPREIYDLLRVVYHHYDNGGHSCGRSRRARILERCIVLVRDIVSPTIDRTELKFHIQILVSMYHDDDYIEKMGWYDHVDREFGLISNVQERVHLMAVFKLLRLTELSVEHRLET